MEATEIPEFSKQVKEGGEESLTHISLSISILAVLVAMVTVLGHRSHTKAILQQSRAGDQWSQYETKKIRKESLEQSLDLLQLQPMVDTKASEMKLEDYRTKLAKWSNDLQVEEARARELEAEVEHAEVRASRFDLGDALLQIAVVLSSITLFTRRRSYFIGGICLGAAGALIAASAWLVH